MALELNGTTGVSLVQDGVVVAADLNSALSDTIGKVKAWVNFDGTGTVAIRASYNVSSLTDNGTGDYSVNFTTAMVDANYSISGGGNGATDLNPACLLTASLTEYNTVSLARVSTTNSSNASKLDYSKIHVQIFR